MDTLLNRYHLPKLSTFSQGHTLDRKHLLELSYSLHEHTLSQISLTKPVYLPRHTLRQIELVLRQVRQLLHDAVSVQVTVDTQEEYVPRQTQQYTQQLAVLCGFLRQQDFHGSCVQKQALLHDYNHGLFIKDFFCKLSKTEKIL